MKEDGSHSFSSVEHCLPFSFYFHRPKDRLRWFLIKRIMYALLYRAIEAEREWIQSENVDRCRRYFQIPSYNNKVRNTKNEHTAAGEPWARFETSQLGDHNCKRARRYLWHLRGRLRPEPGKKGQRLEMFWTIYQLFMRVTQISRWRSQNIAKLGTGWPFTKVQTSHELNLRFSAILPRQ